MGSFDGLFERAKQNYPEAFSGQSGGSQTVPIAHGTVQQTVDFTGLAERAKKNYPEAFSSPKTSGNYLQNKWLKKYQGKGYNSLASSLLELEDGDEKDWLKSYAERVKKSEWNALVATKPSDWIQNSDYGLKAYQQDRETASYDRQLQNWINQMAEAPLRDANPQYYQMVQQYRDDTSYKEINDRWSEEQRRDFGYLYAQDKKKAEEFAIALNEQLNAQAKNQQRQAVQEKATSGVKSGLKETGKAIAAGMLGIGEYMSDVAEYTARGRITEKGDRLSPVEYSNAVTGGISQHLNEKYGTIDDDVFILGGRGLGDVYSLGTSVAQSMASGHLLGGTGTLIAFFGSAAASGIDDAKQRGATDEQAIALGTLQGVAEGIAEKIGVDNLFKRGAANTIRGFLKNVFAQAGSEGIEEGLTSLFNNISENIVMGKNSMFYDRVNGYMENGMNDRSAKKQAWLDCVEDILFDSIAGAASGGVSGSIETGIQNIINPVENATESPGNAADKESLTTELARSEESSAVDDKMSATGVVAENATTPEAVPTLESLSEKYGDRAADMRKTFMEGQDVQEYDRAFQMAYDMGRAGVNESYAQQSEATAYLSETQRSIAYNMGVLDAQSAASAQAAKNAAAANGKTGWRKGTVKGQGVKIADMSKAFNDPQRKSYKYLSSIAEVTGVDIVLYKSEVGADGNYQDSQGKFKWNENTIYIDVNAGLDSYKDAESLAKYTMMRTFDHEFTHFVEKWNPEEYNDFRQIVFEVMEQNGENVEDLIDTMMAKTGGQLSYDQAAREVIAEAMTDILPESNFIEQLARKNQNVFQQLLSQLKEFLSSLKKHFVSMGSSTREAKALKKQMGETVSYMEDIVKKFDEIAVKAVENYQRTVAEDASVSNMEKVVSKMEKTTPDNRIADSDNGKVVSDNRNTDSVTQNTGSVTEEYRSEQGYTIRTNEQYGSLEITFDSKPSQAVRDTLKANKYRWNGKKGVWYGKTDQQVIVDALDKAYEESAAPAPVDLSKKTMERTGDTVTIGAPSKASHKVEITLSDEDYEALMQAVPESKSQDAYTDLETALATANVSVKNGYRFDVRFTPGANIYTGSIERVEDPNGYPVFNARNRMYTTGSLTSRPKVVKELTDVARNNKLLDPRDTEKLAEKAAETGTSDHTPSEVMAARIVDEYLTDDNIRNTRKPLTAAALYEMADKAFGGTQAEGAYNRKDAYDALELAVNKHLLTAAAKFNGNQNAAVYAVAYMQRLLELLPTQSVRTQEQQDFQQFSTPPNIAYLAAWTANITAKDSVLEPSAGIGGLAVFAKAWGAEVSVNELSKRRLEVLRSMGFDHLFNENAEQIDNILPENISPSVVIMNPPFSSTAGRTSTNKTSNAEKHIDQALARLRDGGRLVAILGKGMNNADYSRYWNKLRKEYNIRANLSIDGSNYKKYGTTWGVQIVVIDKTGPQTGETITGSFTDLREVPKVLEGIRNDRSTNIEPASPVESSKGAPESAGAAEGQNPVSDTVGVVDQRPAGNRRSGKRAEPGRTGSTARTDVTEQPGRVQTGDRTGERDGSGSAVQPGRTGKTAQKSRAASDAEQRNGSVPAVEQLDGNAGAESAAERSGHESQSARRAEVEPSDDGVYATFVVPKLPVEGGKPHPAVLVESAAMAAVSMPEATYKPQLPVDVVKNNLSEAQMVTVTYAGQAHEQNLPDGRRKGFFIGDGTGVGKGRQIAGIILDNFMQGRTKAVWISKNNDLYGDAIRDWTATTGRSKEEVLNHIKIKPKDKISLNEGILYSTYDTLKSEKGGNRLDQIVDWVGEDFDGVIAFDEAHNMGNLFGKKGKFGKSKGSEKAKAGVELQRRLPKARIVYVSATAATEVDNLAYAERIGLWGSGTAFADAKDFISKIGSSGLAAMELVIRDMKAMGVYVARSISYNGVNYDTVEHPLDPMQMEIYNTMSKAWQKTMANVQSALISTGGNNNSTARQRAMGNFYSSMQRFYNQVLTSMSMPSVIADMRRELDAGRSCVLQIVNTNEAQQNKQLAEAKAEGRSLDDLDLTPREALIGYLMNSFPTQMFEEYTDEDGNLRSRPVVDSNGAPVHNKKAIQQRDALIAEVNQMSIPDGPLEMLFDAFGTEAVAENTGRSRRVVPKKMADGSISRVEESRTLNHRTADVQAFQDGKKRILIFSDAGGTGKSYHAALNEKNQQQRVHYVLQPGWVASNAVQGFGRTHRSNEASAPVYKLVTTNIKGQKRFTSTIARRLDQLGALTKGQRDTGSGMFGTKDNLETDLARDSLREFYIRLGKNQIEGIEGMKTIDRLGLKQKFTDEFGGFKVNDSLARDIGTFLNRILALEVEEQNTVFDAFISIYEMELEAAMQAGTLDTGMENVKADKIEIVDDQVIREGSSSGASTHYIQAKTYTKPKVVATVAEMATRRTGFVGVYKLENDSIRAVYRIADKTTEWGAIQKQYRLVGPNLGAKNSVWNENTLKAKATEVARKDWQKEWDAEVSRVPEYNESTLHMLTGALLPVWNTLPQEGNTKVKRLIANDGSVYLGRVIDSDMIDGVLGRFSVGRTKETYTAQQVMDKALKDGTKFQLSNNRAEIFRSKVSGEWRLEIAQQNAWYLSRTYPGLIQERIQYRDRYFIPVGDKGIEILNRILEYNPVRNTSEEDYVQYQQRYDTPKRFSYEWFTQKPDMAITEVEHIGKVNTSAQRNQIIEKAMANARSVGTINEQGNPVVHVKDIGKNVMISKTGIRHSMDRRAGVVGSVAVKIGDILSNTVLMNELNPRSENITDSYILIGAAKNKTNEPYIVSFVVNRYTSEVTDIDVLYAVNAKTEPAGSLSPSITAKDAGYFTGSTVTISNLLDFVNQYFPDTMPEDVLKHYGHDRRPDGTLGQDALYQRRYGTLSDRDILAIAANDLSTEEMTEAERGALEIFRDRLAKLDELQEKRLELGRIYREQQFGKSPDRQAAAETLDKMHAMDSRIQEANKKVLDVEEKGVLRDVLKKARKVVEDKQKKHDDEILKRWRDRRNNAAVIKKYRQRITNDVKAMTDWVIHPDNKNIVKHVPDVLKNSVIPFLSSINFTSNRQLQGGSATKADTEFVKRLEKLNQALKDNIDESGLYSGYNDLPPQFMEKLQSFISAVKNITQESSGEFVINRMTSEELKALSEIVVALKKLVQDCNKFHYNSMYRHVWEAGDATIDNLSHYKDAKSRSKTGEAVDHFVFWQQIRPAYAWERFGKGGKAIFDSLRHGQARLAFNTNKIVQFTEKAYTEAEVREWEKEVKNIQLDDGSTIRVKTAQAMSFYELSKDMDSLRHILGQGIRVATYHAGKEKISDVGHLMSVDDVARVIDSLTPRQKEVADSLQKFMADQGGKWGNFVSVKRFGEELFGNPTYFPINSDGRHLQASTDEMPENASLYALLNMSFTKSRNEKANNRIVLYSIFDVFANHMASMAQYNALALPVLDALKWFNYQQKEDVVTIENGSEVVKHTVKDSVRDELNRVYGVAEETRPGSGRRGYAENFITGILKAFNGTEAQGIPTDESGLSMRQRYNMAQVAFNLRVVAQQPLAITRAGMLIPYKSIIRGMKLRPAVVRRNIEEMKKYSGIAAWKDLGFYDINISRGLTDLIKHSENWRDKINETGMWGAEQADRLTWAGIWSACKEEILRNGMKYGEEGFFEAVSELFEEVIYKTQVVDSVLTKNEYMRSKGFWARTTSSFMSEPATNASMLIDAYDKLRMDMQKGMEFSQAWKKNRGRIGRTAYVYGMGAAVLAVVTAVMDALRDDDEYETFLEKWSEAFSGNLIDELNPLGKLPLVKEISEFVKELAAAGWKVDVYGQMSNLPYIDMAEQFIKGVEILSDKINGADTNYTWYGGIYKLLQGVSGISGLPMAATTREVVTIWNNTVGKMAPSYKVKTYDPGPLSNVKYAYQDGYLTEAEATQELLDKGLSDNEDEAYWTIRKWESGNDNFSRYDTINQAIRSGGSITKEMEELTSHGYTSEAVRSHIKSTIGKWYRDGEITKQQAIEMLRKYSDVDRTEITDVVNKWSSKVVTGIEFDDIKDEFMAGNITQSRAAEMYVRYGGYSKDQAAETVSVWAFVKKYPECEGITSDAVKDYTAYCQKAGVPAKSFYQAWKYKNSLSGSVKEPTMEYINSLNLSRNQKDSLYYAFGWAKSRIYEAPWY